QKYPLNYLGGGFPEFTVGDVNFDGSLDVADILHISDMVSGYGYSPTPPADFNGNGEVTITDAILLALYIINN
ncbi:MAG: hypothetical protein HN815_06100, partial [Candidatus Marinimicrobia bacterium]|nr:hypothetical protein [Candidatus Neomarinimicrobiota bacterium]